MEDNAILNFEDDVILPEGYDENTDLFELADGDGEILTTEPTPEPIAETDTTQAQVETPGAGEPTTAPEAQVESPAQTVRIKFNHEERDISIEEAATLAQKGLAYDKTKTRADQAEQSMAQQEQAAKALGYESVQAMIDAARKSFEDHRVQTLVNEGNTEAMARFLVQQEIKATEQVRPQDQTTATEAEPEAKPVQKTPSAFKDGEIEEFVQMYPGVTKIPPEVIDAHRGGMRLSVAYERYQSKQAQEELRVLRQNQAAAARAPIANGVTETGGGKPPEKDPFLEGFDSDNW